MKKPCECEEEDDIDVPFLGLKKRSTPTASKSTEKETKSEDAEEKKKPSKDKKKEEKKSLKESVYLSYFIKAIAEKNYSVASKYLTQEVEAKLKKKISENI
jgi:hypothetical protein